MKWKMQVVVNALIKRSNRFDFLISWGLGGVTNKKTSGNPKVNYETQEK